MHDLGPFGKIRGRKQGEADPGLGLEYWISAGVPYHLVAKICALGAA